MVLQVVQNNKFGNGLLVLFRGWATLKEYPSLKKWILLPLLVDLLVFVIGLVTLGGWIQGLILSMSTWLVGLLSFLQSFEWIFGLIYYPLLFIAFVAFAILWIYLTFIIGTIVAAPFNALLAEKTLLQLKVIEEESFSLKSWIGFTLRMLVAALTKAVVFSLFGVVLFICSFIPGLNIVSAYGALLIVTFDCFDYSYEVLGLNFGQRIKTFLGSLPMASGMAAGMGATLIIPGSTLLLLPLAVVGASRLLADSRG
ncbi:MAG: hypothetical protein CL677_04080 [Bdellovibrionaceae bacterium]|nr:hypothetical protein [Pseudobdellovibrionaceae bacterium]|tara:strand:- start:53434 stop:54198 length:765 start_codon:yes stop_codon:yes gene_type:complete